VIGTSPAHYRLPTGALTVARRTAAALGTAVLGTAAALGPGLVGRRRLVTTVEVAGDSMRPTLHPGDRLVVVRVPGRWVRPGDLVTLPDPRQPDRVVVKRVAAVAGGAVEVRGDDPSASTDSRTFGPVPASSLRGRVVYRYAPEARRGRPRRERYAGSDVD
jgi:nickel-type superoxide dismutase maturation protease